MDSPAPHRPTVAVIGAGPAGLMAAETIAAAGVDVTVFDRMSSPGRKLLMAGRGGLNLTHSEACPPCSTATGRRGHGLKRRSRHFRPPPWSPGARGWASPTFVGSSGRVFPRAMKASPLLRAWLARLAGLGRAAADAPDLDRLGRRRRADLRRRRAGARRARRCWRWAAPPGRGWGRTAAGPGCCRASRCGRCGRPIAAFGSTGRRRSAASPARR